jgi:PRTRC genetic system protein A
MSPPQNLKSQRGATFCPVNYGIAREKELPPFPANCLYQYLFAGNGTFLRSENRAFSLVKKLADCPAVGLAELAESFTFKLPLIPRPLSEQIWQLGCQCYPAEVVVQLAFRQGAWQVKQPRQATTPESAHWQDGDEDFQADVAVELHSHGGHPAFFSAADDSDERQLRIYAVMGRVAQQPEILVRAGIYGQCFQLIPAAKVFEMPSFLSDVYPNHRR